MCIKSCQCCLKISEVEQKINKVIEEIAHIKNKGYNFKYENSKKSLVKESLTQTLLLDFSETQQPSKYTFGSIHQTLTKLNNKINELQLRCSILPSIKESISKQTQIIHYLQGRVEAFGSQKSENSTLNKSALKKCALIPKDFECSAIYARKQRKVLQPSKHLNSLSEGI